MNVVANLFFRFVPWATFGIFALTARGVEVGLTNTYQTNDPGTAPWNYVGDVNGASGVFLGDYGGNYWVLTAAHVGAGSFVLNGVTYNAISGSAFSIFNSDNSLADLTLFRISSGPALAALADLPVTFSAPAQNTTVQMIGFGGPAKSWGDNTIAGYSSYTLSGLPYGGPGIITLASGEGGNGAQGVGGDSGGGMFVTSAGTWALTGILSGVGTFTDNNGHSLGDGTIAVDLAVYYNQIGTDINSVSAIPEPTTDAALAGLGALLSVVLVRRRSARR